MIDVARYKGSLLDLDCSASLLFPNITLVSFIGIISSAPSVVRWVLPTPSYEVSR